MTDNQFTAIVLGILLFMGGVIGYTMYSHHQLDIEYAKQGYIKVQGGTWIKPYQTLPQGTEK